jgi:ATP-dependent exoDNAse (exonuclease V) beta subunit
MKLLVKNPYNYKHILAVTFTNKATSEMKERILRDLYSLSKGENEPMLKLLSAECVLNGEEVILNAKKALSLILHDYDRFSVSTIDSFFQSVLRSFARESGLYGSYEIDLDQAAVLAEASDRLLLSVENDHELRDWLLQMAETQLEDGKNWQIKEKISELGKELNKPLFNDYRLHQGTLAQERAKLKQFNTELIKVKKWFESECRKMGDEGLSLMQKHGLTLNDFKYKGSSFANAFNKLKNFKGGELLLGVRFANAPDNIDAWPSAKENRAAVEACYNSGLNELVKRVIEFEANNSQRYYTASEIYKNIYALGVLTTLAINVREVGLENNSLLLSESDSLLHGIIGHNDAPFIYEKAGNYYHYFMIDEFQDTSVIQWENFKPLVVNSLAENNPNLVVGDVKQSIYRWRNSDWQLLGSRIKDELQTFGVIEKNLDSNWRSRENVVEFNNHFFGNAATMLQNRYNSIVETGSSAENPFSSIILDAFKDVEQKAASNKEGGKVSIQLIESESSAEYRVGTINQLINQIEKLQDEGIKASEIAILVRKNSQGNEIANALLSHRKNRGDKRYNFEVISDDSLYLASSVSVRFLTSMLKFVVAPWDKVVKSASLFQFERYILPFLGGKVDDRDSNNSFFSHGIEADYFPFFAEGSSNAISKRWATLSIIDLENELEQRYHLDKLPGEQASLQAFRDVIIDFSKKEGGNLHKFIEWWSENGNRLKVQTSVERDAIRILSIHKSKGLEFPIVMIPFCDWSFEPDARKGNILWCKADSTVFDGFPVLPVNFSKILQKTVFADSYFTEMMLSHIDNLNLLYVAFTRAVDGLFVFAEATEKGNTVSSLFNDIFVNVAGQTILQQSNEKQFSTGELRHDGATVKKGNEINLSESIELKQQLADSLKLHKNYDGFFEEGSDYKANRINEGKLMHELLSLIDTRSDVSLAVRRLISDGKLDAEKTLETIEKLEELLQNPVVESWFDGSFKVLNETPILSPGYDIKRPDRVMVQDNEAIVVDYKTTAIVSESHRRQVENYVSKIGEMGFTKVEGYVWYLNSNRLLNIAEQF